MKFLQKSLKMGCRGSRSAKTEKHYISNDDYEFIKNITSMPLSEVNKIFDEFHKAGDGYLNKEQFVKLYIPRDRA